MGLVASLAILWFLPLKKLSYRPSPFPIQSRAQEALWCPSLDAFIAAYWTKDVCKKDTDHALASSFPQALDKIQQNNTDFYFPRGPSS